MGTEVIAMQNDTAELICYRHFDYTVGVTEQVLDLNPGLASLGPILPSGTKVILPDVAEQQEQTNTINLWD